MRKWENEEIEYVKGKREMSDKWKMRGMGEDR